ncbi:flagellar hook capping protein FlgD [Defluviimonas sp. 20V17]|uniref:Basal-body rod modification protein FlgD n=1 Tax=Allgaiera indica TaxID=765699 RepID=A0AAN4UP32_9RHOB|nr:flagellar hook assembly protein FlgD [Allgaiera indica]KDB03904.1 flagellar hook capping protein FlgD [Defluviimonas sp. 20V17]GHD99230.1 hypothetical protein GCM10008024_05780 [Allgaiera indica]SDW30937.1 flagellar basal-body rod modification protein FlgD [Allgaiera indica]
MTTTIPTNAAPTAASPGATVPGATGTSTGAAAKAQGQLGVDYNNFLKLLTAQIQNQDPLKPMDSTQFVQQLAQLSQVEQSVQTNKNLETLNTKVGAMSGMASLGMLGRSVSLASDRIELSGGAGQTRYRLAGAAASVTATVVDASGTTVRKLTGLPTAGGTMQNLSWDGRNDAGLAQPDGVYHVKINAVDASGKTISYDTYPTTVVDQVLFGSAGETLKLRNGAEVSPGDILSAG